MNGSNVKFISDVDVPDAISVKKPFHLKHEQARRYIRLEISEPVIYSIIKDGQGSLNLNEHDMPVYNGSILNLSAGGVLILCDREIRENAIVMMKMTVQDIELIDRIIGRVKRSEYDGDDWLVGIEFISREQMNDHFSKAEIDLIPEEASSFTEQIRSVLNRYIYSQKVEREPEV